MALQWKNGATWEDIPEAALYSTWAGTYHIEYPPPQSVAIDGSQAGQTGKPRIVIKAPWLTDSGFDFWRDRFSSATAETAAISIEAWDPRSGAKSSMPGSCNVPPMTLSASASTTTNTIYRNVSIEIWECATTT